jgi:hypothetical protein
MKKAILDFTIITPDKETLMDLIGKALTMSDLVAYSEGSVVSKTLIDK